MRKTMFMYPYGCKTTDGLNRMRSPDGWTWRMKTGVRYRLTSHTPNGLKLHDIQLVREI